MQDSGRVKELIRATRSSYTNGSAHGVLITVLSHVLTNSEQREYKRVMVLSSNNKIECKVLICGLKPALNANILHFMRT